MNEYYVYVYIDPRNFEEFYFGKGKGSRKSAHISDDSDSEKAKRIKAIHAAGLQPIIKVIARNLSEHDALLVEKTLLWKLGRQLTNISSGHYAANFRPHDTMHLNLTGFDYKNGIYYYNVGEGHHRNWDDYITYGFISAGGGVRWRDAILSFEKGDIVAAYLKGKGFVGIGRVIQPAKPIRNVIIKGKPLLQYPLACQNMTRGVDSDEFCEYPALIKWIKTFDRNNAKWKANSKLFTTQLVKASLDHQPETIAFLEDAFDLDLRTILGD